MKLSKTIKRRVQGKPIFHVQLYFKSNPPSVNQILELEWEDAQQLINFLKRKKFISKDSSPHFYE